MKCKTVLEPQIKLHYNDECVNGYTPLVRSLLMDITGSHIYECLHCVPRG